jgi:pyruvate/2-oxoglutarate dehydrogenase complex dihydrolipoamide acyltransferase (E2) component
MTMLNRSRSFETITRADGVIRYRQDGRLFFGDGSPCHETEPAAPAAAPAPAPAADAAPPAPPAAPAAPVAPPVAPAAERYAKEKFFKVRAICMKLGFTPKNMAQALEFLAKHPEA